MGQLPTGNHGRGVGRQVDGGDLGGDRAGHADQDQPDPEVSQRAGPVNPEQGGSRPGDRSPGGRHPQGEGAGPPGSDGEPDHGSDQGRQPSSVDLDGQGGPDDHHRPQETGVVVASDGHPVSRGGGLDQGLVGADGDDEGGCRQAGDGPLPVVGEDGSGPEGPRRRLGRPSWGPGRDQDGARRDPAGHDEQAEAQAGPVGEGVDRGHHPDPGHRGGPDGGHPGQDHDHPTQSGARSDTSGRPSVEGGHPGQPGDETGRLDRVPGPVPAPPQFDVGPHGPGDQPDRQHGQGDDQDSTVEMAPSGCGSPQGGGGCGQGWHQEAGETGVEDRGVPDHGWVLQHRLEAEPVNGGNRQPLEGRSGNGQDRPVPPGEQGPEPDHPPLGPNRATTGRSDIGAAGHQGPGHRAAGDHPGPGHHCHPQQQRAFRPGPHPRQAQPGADARAGVVGDVGQRPGLGHEAPTEQDHQRGGDGGHYDVEPVAAPPIGSGDTEGGHHDQDPQPELTKHHQSMLARILARFRSLARGRSRPVVGKPARTRPLLS